MIMTRDSVRKQDSSGWTPILIRRRLGVEIDSSNQSDSKEDSVTTLNRLKRKFRLGSLSNSPRTPSESGNKMGFEGLSISRLRRQQQSKRFLVGKRSEEAKLVLLHDWWLVKAYPESHGKQLCIGGFTSKNYEGIRSFCSAPIVKRHDAVTLETVDSITIMLHGYLNVSRALENGFSQEVSDHFLIGFPYYWEDFASLSVSEEPVHSSPSTGGTPCDAYKTPADEASRCNRTSTSPEKEASVPIQSMDSAVDRTRKQTKRNPADGPLTRSMDSAVDRTRKETKRNPADGPLTRSRARFLKKKK